MSRVARKTEGAATFFRVDGADQETGEETYLVLRAATKPQAEKLARKQGMLISSVRVARADDWHAPARRSPEPPVAPSAATLDAMSEPLTAPEPPDAFVEPPSLPPPAERAPAPAAVRNGDDDPAYPSPTAAFVEPTSERAASPRADVIEPATVPAGDNASDEEIPAAGGSSAAAVVLGFVGAALVIGGVLALVLGLWPDNTVRNELEKIDYRLHEVSQTILGCMLVLSGMMTFTLAIICYLLPKRNRRT